MTVIELNLNNTVRQSIPTDVQKNFISNEFSKSKSLTAECKNSYYLSGNDKNHLIKSYPTNFKNHKKNSKTYSKGLSKNNDEKTLLVSSRSLPCKTYISCGDCPYRDRCTFLHDPLLCSKFSVSKPNVCNTDINNKHDLFYWKPMPFHQLQKSNRNSTKSNNSSDLTISNIDCIQSYFPAQLCLFDNNGISSNYQNVATDSMWSNVTKYCKETEDSREACKRRARMNNCNVNIAYIDNTINIDCDTNTTLSITAKCNATSPTHNDISGIKRSNIFVRLASGESIQDDDDQQQQHKAEEEEEEEEGVLNNALQHVNNMCTPMVNTHVKNDYDNISVISVVSSIDSFSTIDAYSANKHERQSVPPSSSLSSLVSVATTLPDESDVASQSLELSKSVSAENIKMYVKNE